MKGTFKNTCKQLRSLQTSLSIQAKILINCLLAAIIILVLVCTNFFEQLDAFDVEKKFLKDAKMNLLGSPQIIAVMQVEGTMYDHIVLADGGDAAVLYACNSKKQDIAKFAYVKKQGNVTLTSVPTTLGKDDNSRYAIVLFDDCPEAARAEVEVVLKHDRKPYRWRLSLSAKREEPGCFLFYTKAGGYDTPEREIHLFLTGSTLSLAGDNGKCEARVILYDKDDAIVLTKQIIIRTPIASKHIERGDALLS